MSKFKFNPEKKEVNSPLTNMERADNGLACVEEVFDFSSNDIECAVGDCLANIFHLCDRDGLDVDRVIRSAKMHWQAER